MIQYKMKCFTLWCRVKRKGELFMAKKGLVFLHFMFKKLDKILKWKYIC